jgi:hypothetical protein
LIGYLRLFSIKMKTQKQLIIGKKEKQKLSKLQQAFNRLVKKLEKLRTAKENLAKNLSEKLDYYGKHIHPLEEKVAELHKRSAKTFYRLYLQEKLSQSDKEVLLDIIDSQLTQFNKFSREEFDDELKEIYELLTDENFDEAEEERFQAMKDDMKETFGQFGINIDLDGFTSDLSDEEMARKMREFLGDVQSQAEAKAAEEPQRKKTKKQIEKEEREKQVEEAKSKNIASIYKQLARVFHPDLEQDADKKLEKESLMKQLTAAYEKGDLHTLLRLELEWLHKEESDLEKLSDDKLKIYNQALKEQVEDLEIEIQLSLQHPRYSPLEKYTDFFSGIERVNLKREKEKLEFSLEYIEADLAVLESDKPQKKLKEIIKETRKQLKNQNLFNINLDDFFA